jgi:mannose-6-phosphate isomerase-like protein (cupin superfamily)
MVQYVRRVEDVPGFSDIPAPGHEKTKAVDKILIDPVTCSHNFMLIWIQLEPESGTELHTHPVEQAYFILSGALKVHIAGEDYIAERNSAVLIPAGVEHKLMTKSKEPTTFLMVFAPPINGFASRPH